MSSLPPIGALWIGGSLTWLEQLCLKSFVHHGHDTYLFTYGEVRNVPDGVIVRDGRDILDTDNFILHERTQSVALFSDKFRFHMIKANPDIIYVDTDVYCLKPIDLDTPYIFGYQKYYNDQRGIVNGAVLKLPGDSQLLASMLDFTANEYPMAKWLPAKLRDEIQTRHDAGNPMHVSEMRWGIWGPGGLTAFARQTGEIAHALGPEYFYPVTYTDRRDLLRRPMATLGTLTDKTYAIHMWAPIKRLAAKRYDGLCPPNSYAGLQLRLHGIDPAKAPIPKTKARAVVE